MELTLFVKKSFVDHVKLVFLYNPTTTAKIGGSFDLTDGSLQKEGTINGPPGTNKKCNTIHQKATIRVNMERREASLFIDDEEQRGKISFEREPMTLGILMESKLRKADLDILQVKFLPADGCGERGIDLKEKEEQMTKAVIEHTTQIKTLQKKIETLEREKKEEMKKTKQAEERADRFEHLRDEIEFDFSLLGSEKSLIEEENTLLEAEKRRLEEENKRLEQELVGLPIWKGTTSLGTGEFHTRSPTLLTQTTLLETDEWRSVFSFDVGSKVWELKIRISSERSTSICLGFLKSPLPRDPSLQTPGSNSKWVGGHFVLCDGSVWTKGKVQSEPGTNKTLTKAGQTAAIQVDLQKKEARLFVDDEIQPGVIRGIPSKLCLTISTGFAETDTSVEVMWMKKFDPIAPK
ncbi:hypothetical protein BLNAU_15578 [Blattamonas nauphoetae]|uniref:Uncharacterized protein n=1 Tax=Blattamonas nauphoetae TaxID=2049346 RepID=A0ABQ9XDQ4_9EUKA|nr:hypothetical protein BLNAU_15578 [Blattamonas nauphoetae]